jgi:hypothetical protein
MREDRDRQRLRQDVLARRKTLAGRELRKIIAERTLHRVRDSRRMRDREINNPVPARRTMFRGQAMCRGPEHPKMETHDRRTETHGRKLRLAPERQRTRLQRADKMHRVQELRTTIRQLAG